MDPVPPASLCLINFACAHLGFFPFHRNLLKIDWRVLKKEAGIGIGSVRKKYNIWGRHVILKAANLPDQESSCLTICCVSDLIF